MSLWLYAMTLTVTIINYYIFLLESVDKSSSVYKPQKISLFI